MSKIDKLLGTCFKIAIINFITLFNVIHKIHKILPPLNCRQALLLTSRLRGPDLALSVNFVHSKIVNSQFRLFPSH